MSCPHSVHPFADSRYNPAIYATKKRATVAVNNNTNKCSTSREIHNALFYIKLQNNIYTPIPRVSSPVENRSCSESTRCCVQCVIASADANPFLMGLSWPSGMVVGHNGERRKVSLRFRGPRSKPDTDSWSNSLKVGIYPVSNASRHVIMSPLYRIKMIYV